MIYEVDRNFASLFIAANKFVIASGDWWGNDRNLDWLTNYDQFHSEMKCELKVLFELNIHFIKFKILFQDCGNFLTKKEIISVGCWFWNKIELISFRFAI